MFRAKGALYESRYIRVSNRVELPHALPKVWSLFQDGAAVIQCVPGVELVEDKGEGVCTTKVEVRLGVLGARFEGETTFAADWSSRAVTITGRAVEKVGGSKGRIGMLCRFQETDAATEIHINTEVTLVGAAAHFADAELVRERFNGLVGEFAQRVGGQVGRCRFTGRAGTEWGRWRKSMCSNRFFPHQGVFLSLHIEKAERSGSSPGRPQRFQEGPDSGSIQ